ncbi:Mg chelatase-like protein [Burkholderia sp. 8Y]|uniref:integrase n=1 Tax=Burkholderia sp. 8Y TaxID=2653133 RepID=UPI0012EEE70D|nr:integrase [Burkholderia sp. 8Y]VXB46421.1 Mg chelatase-like protein [Burkholderia sp. 8Y]
MNVKQLPHSKIDSPAFLLTQPDDLRLVPKGLERDKLVISVRKVNGKWRVLSRYGDEIWWLTGATTNTRQSETKIDFFMFPPSYRDLMKQVIYRYMRKGGSNRRRLAASSLNRNVREISYFIRHIQDLGITRLGDISPLVCNNYVHAMRSRKETGGKALTPAALYKRIKAVTDLHYLSQYTSDPIREHPWPDSSSHHLSGSKKGGRDKRDRKTPLIPDDIFVTLFQSAWKTVVEAPPLLDLRDEMRRRVGAKPDKRRNADALRDLGFEGAYGEFVEQVHDIRAACYVVIASLSGCRNHELAFLRANSCYSTTDDDSLEYWWMRSESTKTFEGATEWMIPDAAVTALRVLERWAAPYQDMLRGEIAAYQSADVNDIRVAEAQDHLDALFVGVNKATGNRVRTLSLNALNSDLKKFAKACGVDWNLASHQFRRKFANYAARSQFGDLRYLKAHFKHWSMEMTLGYALNDSQEMLLYLEIEDELDDLKEAVVSTWLDASEPLSGGYGTRLVDWRSRDENIGLFKNHAAMVASIARSTPIRSNGHAWCTADDNLCPGNDLEPTRCGDGCNSAVIGRPHTHVYHSLFHQLRQLESAEDIGPSGRARVAKDVSRCADVLAKLGCPIEDSQNG